MVLLEALTALMGDCGVELAEFDTVRMKLDTYPAADMGDNRDGIS